MKIPTFLALLATVTTAFSQTKVPTLINYQGYVTDSAQAPLGDGAATNYDVEFRLYENGTTTDALWGEQQTVTILDGQFSVLLGNGIAIPGQAVPRPALETFFTPGPNALEQVFIGITVNTIGQTTEAELTPRQQLVANPFALQALNADRAVTADTVAAGSIDNSAIAAGSVDAAKIAAGAVGPTQIAELSITSGKLDRGAVTSSKIASRAVTGPQIAVDTITDLNIAANAVGTSEIAPNAVGNSELTPDDLSIRKMTGNKILFTTGSPGGGTVGGIAINRSIIFLGESRNQDGVSGPYSLQVGSGAPVQISSFGELVRNTSSKRYKENIRPLESDPSLILDAEPKTYNRLGAPGTTEIGLIAEELDALGLNDLIIRDLEGRPDAVSYDRIPLYLLEIAKDQRSKITDLESENAALAERLERLEKQLLAK